MLYYAHNEFSISQEIFERCDNPIKWACYLENKMIIKNALRKEINIYDLLDAIIEKKNVELWVVRDKKIFINYHVFTYLKSKNVKLKCRKIMIDDYLKLKKNYLFLRMNRISHSSKFNKYFKIKDFKMKNKYFKGYKKN